MKVLCVIPARYASTRLPGKPLAMIAGKPMIQHVYERACRAVIPQEVVVATDSDIVAAAVKGFGGKVMMTSPDHPSGTDRLAEVALSYGDIDVKGHLGQIPGHTSIMGRDEKAGTTIMLIQNSGAGDFESFYLKGVNEPAGKIFHAVREHG